MFTKSNIFVQPKEGMATFFSYKGRDNHMDHGLTGSVTTLLILVVFLFPKSCL